MATYNCTDSTSNAYGSGSYGTCATTAVGAPDTGFFQSLVSGGSFTIVVPLAVAIIVTAIATIVIGRRKKAKA